MDVINWMISSKEVNPCEIDEQTEEFLCVCHELLSSPIALDVWELFYKYKEMEPKWTWTLDHTILHLLRFPPEGGTEQLREFIDKWGLDINQQDRDGNTPFMWAFRSQRYQYALQLLACGADETITNSYKLDWRVWCPPLKDVNLYEMNLSAQATIEYILAQDLI